MTKVNPVSPTSHALLGLLAIRSWTAYELTQQMNRALRWAWPRTEANLYAEIKRLVPLGLATSGEEFTGGRSRTRYRVTEQGRSAIAEWLRTEPGPVRVQFETLLRLFLADQGSLDELRASISATRRQTIESIAEVLPIAEEYAGDAPPYPGRAHLNVLFIAFMADFFRTVLTWCDAAEQEIATWPETAEVGLTAGTRRMVDDVVEFYRSVLSEGQEAAR